MSKSSLVKVSIKDLTFDTIIGILDFERKKAQRVMVNCSFKYKYKNEQFIDYSQIASEIKNTIIEEKFELIEDALSFVSQKLKAKYNLKKLKLSIAKPDILKDCSVEIKLEK